MNDSRPPRARQVTCPACGGFSEYSPRNSARPFCSARCKTQDLSAWASESFRVQAAPEEDEAPPAATA